VSAEVWYYDSDAQGRPNTAAGVQGPVQCQSVLTLAPGTPVYAVATRPETNTVVVGPLASLARPGR